jgi:uncharacterized protein (DUF302 family)
VTAQSDQTPSGTQAVDGVVHRRSPYSVTESVDRLSEAIRAAGAKIFAVIDHSGEAEQAGLSLRETKLLIFGNPTAGTPAMVEAPTAALDLPLKILVWEDDVGMVWMSYVSGEWLAHRHHIPDEHAKALAATSVLTGRISAAP